MPPPPGDQLRAGVEDLLSWMHDPPGLPPVIQAAMTHYQFETPLLVVSPWFEARRERYRDALLQLSLDGDWDAWIGFFAAGVAASARESHLKVERLVELQTELREIVQEAGKRVPAAHSCTSPRPSSIFS